MTSQFWPINTAMLWKKFWYKSINCDSNLLSSLHYKSPAISGIWAFSLDGITNTRPRPRGRNQARENSKMFPVKTGRVKIDEEWLLNFQTRVCQSCGCWWAKHRCDEENIFGQINWCVSLFHIADKQYANIAKFHIHQHFIPVFQGGQVPFGNTSIHKR